MSEPKKPESAVLSASQFPLPLGSWMEQFLSFSVPDEIRADCGDCPMVKGAPPANGIRFTSKARCCTYVPKLSNFQVGAAFLDDDPALAFGRERLTERLSSRRGVTPLGIFPDQREKSAYQKLGEEERFGSADEFICPYHMTEGAYGCGIWKYRPSACCTWFCRHVRGAVSKDFWKKLYKLLAVTEQAVQYQCLVEMDVSPEALSRMLPPMDDNPVQDFVSDEAYHAVWGPWSGKEVGFYTACAQYAAGLDWRDLEKTAGPELTIRLRQLKQAESAFQNNVLPNRLLPGRFFAAGISDRPEMTRVISYLKTDDIEVPTSVMMMMYHFDGRPLPEILAEVRHQGLDEKVVGTLRDFRILVEPRKG